jgi:hypothetical protein
MASLQSERIDEISDLVFRVKARRRGLETKSSFRKTVKIAAGATEKVGFDVPYGQIYAIKVYGAPRPAMVGAPDRKDLDVRAVYFNPTGTANYRTKEKIKDRNDKVFIAKEEDGQTQSFMMPLTLFIKNNHKRLGGSFIVEVRRSA